MRSGAAGEVSGQGAVRGAAPAGSVTGPGTGVSSVTLNGGDDDAAGDNGAGGSDDGSAGAVDAMAVASACRGIGITAE